MISSSVSLMLFLLAHTALCRSKKGKVCTFPCTFVLQTSASRRRISALHLCLQKDPRESLEKLYFCKQVQVIYQYLIWGLKGCLWCRTWFHLSDETKYELACSWWPSFKKARSFLLKHVSCCFLKTDQHLSCLFIVFSELCILFFGWLIFVG